MHSTAGQSTAEPTSAPARQTEKARADEVASARHPSSRGDGSPVRGWQRQLARRLLQAAGDPPMSLILWNGEEIGSSAAPTLARLRIHKPATLLKLLRNPSFEFGEAYSRGDIDIQGDLVEMLVALSHSMADAPTRTGLRNAIVRWFHNQRTNWISGARENIHHHYDLGNAFYELWLDEQMAYTCAYFPTPDASLEAAQRAKFDHVCRKVGLRPGQRVVEAGCGWGGLALHMARHYGVTVKAYNISTEQIAYARELARRRGLDGQVEFIDDDWRNITGTFDAFVSVGMLEHVGRKNYRRLGEVIDRCLTDRGRGLVHSIGRNRPEPLDAWIDRRIFPGAYPPTLREMMDVFEPCGLSVLDVENLRLHYALTLRHWLARYEHAIEKVREMFDETFARAWRLYLAGSIAAFETGGLQLFQVAFARPTLNDVPRTRAHLYRQPAAADHNVPQAADARGPHDATM